MADSVMAGRAPAPMPAMEDLSMSGEQSAEDLVKGGCKCSGWLHKMGAKHKAWRLRWTVLKNGHVFYYKTPQSPRPQGQFCLDGYKVKIREGGFKRNFVFALLPPSGGRVWNFSAANVDDMQHWVKELRLEIQAKYAGSEQGRTYDEDSDTVDSENYDEPYDDSILLDNGEGNVAAGAPPRPPKSGDSAASDPAHLIPIDADHFSASWFLEGTSREQVASILTEHGSFALRQKSETSGFALSVSWDGKLRHYKIYHVEPAGYSLGGDESEFFPSVVALLRAYQTKSLPGSGAQEVILGKAHGLH